MLTGFGSFGATDEENCISAGNVWTGEPPYPCRSPEFVKGGADASAAAAIEQAKSYPGLFCSAVNGKYSWYRMCACAKGDGNCESLVKKAKVNEIFGLPKPAAYALMGAVGLLGLSLFMKRGQSKTVKAGGVLRSSRA